eukprot:Rhum_TRINITY_DN15662_c0_g1::Rhum_TRINITY_DN15662_c0_g1_i1::g.161801::m.161801
MQDAEETSQEVSAETLESCGNVTVCAELEPDLPEGCEGERCTYEQQRWFPVVGWGAKRLPTDYPEWGMGKRASKREAIAIPLGSEWSGPWQLDSTCGDEDSWEYAGDWWWSYHDAKKKTDCVRRRRWYRPFVAITAVKKLDKENELLIYCHEKRKLGLQVSPDTMVLTEVGLSTSADQACASRFIGKKLVAVDGVAVKELKELQNSLARVKKQTTICLIFEVNRVEGDSDAHADFQTLFSNALPQTERPLNAFKCSYTPGPIAKMGTMYITQNYVCFSSVMCPDLILPFAKMVKMEKRSGKITNGIAIHLKEGSSTSNSLTKYYFSSFFHREDAYELMNRLYSAHSNAGEYSAADLLDAVLPDGSSAAVPDIEATDGVVLTGNFATGTDIAVDSPPAEETELNRSMGQLTIGSNTSLTASDGKAATSSVYATPSEILLPQKSSFSAMTATPLPPPSPVAESGADTSAVSMKQVTDALLSPVAAPHSPHTPHTPQSPAVATPSATSAEAPATPADAAEAAATADADADAPPAAVSPPLPPSADKPAEQRPQTKATEDAKNVGSLATAVMENYVKKETKKPDQLSESVLSGSGDVRINKGEGTPARLGKSQRATSPTGRRQSGVEVEFGEPVIKGGEKEAHSPGATEVKWSETQEKVAELNKALEQIDCEPIVDGAEQLVECFKSSFKAKNYIDRLGTMWLTSKRIIFISSFINPVVIPFSEVTEVVKKKDLVFLSALVIKTKGRTYTFTAFMQRDSAFSLLEHLRAVRQAVAPSRSDDETELGEVSVSQNTSISSSSGGRNGSGGGSGGGKKLGPTISNSSLIQPFEGDGPDVTNTEEMSAMLHRLLPEVSGMPFSTDSSILAMFADGATVPPEAKHLVSGHAFPDHISLASVFDLLFSGRSGFLSLYHGKLNAYQGTKSKKEKIKIPKWTVPAEAKERRSVGSRSFTCTTVVYAPWEKHTRYVEKQRYGFFVDKEKGPTLLVHCVSQTPDVMYGDSFRIEVLLRVTQSLKDDVVKCHLDVYSLIFFVSQPFVKQKIINTASTELANSYKMFCETATTYISTNANRSSPSVERAGPSARSAEPCDGGDGNDATDAAEPTALETTGPDSVSSQSLTDVVTGNPYVTAAAALPLAWVAYTFYSILSGLSGLLAETTLLVSSLNAAIAQVGELSEAASACTGDESCSSSGLNISTLVANSAAAYGPLSTHALLQANLAVSLISCLLLGFLTCAAAAALFLKK